MRRVAMRPRIGCLFPVFRIIDGDVIPLTGHLSMIFCLPGEQPVAVQKLLPIEFILTVQLDVAIAWKVPLTEIEEPQA
ncbi:MAG: hypothetical protein ACI8Z1_001582 [Candidatus Azotimanducaceae bacterium]